MKSPPDIHKQLRPLGRSWHFPLRSLPEVTLQSTLEIPHPMMSTSAHNTVVTNVVEFGEETNIRQPVQDHPHWQDSVVLVWWDPDNEVGGFHRLGHEPNHDGGFAVLWSSLVTPAGIFKRTHTKSLRDEDVIPGGGYGSGDGTCTVEYQDGQHIWTFSEPEEDIQARIVHRDTGPIVDCFPKKGAIKDNFAAAHFDIPGTISGSVSFKGEAYEVRNGLSVRDHGYGPREWGAVLLSHRWIVGTSGPDFSVIAISWHSSDDRYANFGWVVRNNVVTVAKDLDITTYVGDDSLINRGGKFDVELVTGEKFLVEWKPVAKGAVSWHRGVASVDRLCSFRAVGEGKEYSGFGDYESTSNFHSGKRAPGFLIDGIVKDGFSAA